MKKYTEPLQPDTFYHIFNRGTNGETIFKEERNYQYFLEKYALHLSPVVNTYAYCLLGNHFHILLKVKSKEDLIRFQMKSKDDVPRRDVILIEPSDKIISKQFATFFKTYTLAINKAYERTGGLFETPFRRIEVDNDAYFSQLVRYIHQNPQKHGFIDDFREYSHSSYHSHLFKNATKLQREDVLEWFGGKEQYVEFHTMQKKEFLETKYLLEFDKN